MERNPNYNYPYQTTGHTRYASSHGTSSAFSASANPNEDWTKISDLAERRRIQNRIAQRNYRKKLKRRLEDLERRAASSSASPEQTHEELALPNPETTEENRSQSRRKYSAVAPQFDRRRTPEPLFNDCILSQGDRGSMFSQQCTRQLSASPPPSFSYSTYPSGSSGFHMPYSHQSTYQHLAAPYTEISYQNQYLPPLPATLPTAMPSSKAMKREILFPEDDIMNPFGMSYASMAGIDLPTTQTYSDPCVQTPSLTHSTSFDDSRESSPTHSQLAFPITPASIPASPSFSLCSVG